MIFKQIPTAISNLNKLGSAIKAISNIDSKISIGSIGLNSDNLLAYQNAIKGLSAEQAVFALATKKVNAEQINEIMTTETAILSKGAYTQADIQAALAKNKLATSYTVMTAAQKQEIINSGLITSEKMAEIASVLGLTEIEGGALISKKALNAETVKQQLTSLGVTGAAQAQMLSIFGVTAAEGAAVVSTNILTAAFQKLKQTIMSNPYLFIIGAVLGGCIALYNIIKKLNPSLEDQQEITQKLQNELSEIQSSISDITSEIETLTDRIDELNSKDHLSFVEQDELDKLNAQNEALKRRQELLLEDEKRKKRELAASVYEEYKKDTNIKGKDGIGFDKVSTSSKRQNINEKKERYKYLSNNINSEEELAEYNRLEAEIEEFNKGMVGAKDTLTYEEHIQNLIDVYNELYSKEELSDDEQAQLSSIREELVKNSALLNDYSNRYGIDDEISQSWNNLIDLIYKNLYTPQYLTEEFNKVFSGLSQKIQKEINEAAKNGSLSIDNIDDILSDEIIEKFSDIGIYPEDIVNQIYAMLEKQGELPDNPHFSFSDFFNSASFSDTANDLLDLAKAGEFTPSVLESTEEYKKLLDETGLSAEEAADRILNLLSGQEKLAAASKGLDSLQSAYTEFKELGFVTAATLESLPDMFKELEGFDIFSKIVGDPTQGEEKIQQAFNDIINNYIIAQDTLFGLVNASESEIQSYIANLKEMGITNADELVSSLLTFYKSDYDNWCDLLTKKAEAYNDFTLQVDQFLASSNTLFKDGLPEEIEEKMKRGELSFGEAFQVAGNSGGANALLSVQAKYVKYSEKVQEMEDNLKSLYNSTYTPNDSPADSPDSTSQSFDWLETKITRTNEALDRLDRKTSDTYSSWAERNNALTQSVNRTREAIELQRQAYNAYMKEADSVGLPEHYKKLVQNGALRIEDVDDSNIADQISEYQDLYEKAISCSDTVAELEQSLNELSFNTKWENIKTELDAVVSVFDADIDLIQTRIDALEIRGLFANSSYYTEMSALTQRKLDTLNSEAAQLKSIMSAMPQDNEGYDAMLSELMDINKEIAELENNCIEFNNNIRDLDWEIFEYLEESINRITDETEYLIGLLENENLFDEGGNFTEYADAALGLHSAAYETYKRQAQDYYSEVLELQKQLVDGAGQEVLEHYNEIVDAHRDAVSAAESEKQAILDLIEDGYDAQLDALQSLIDKKKEQLDTEKNLYDYQKSIAEKTANVSSLEKQMLAYKDDDSEEAMSRIQQLKVELEEAKSDLAETEYEQYLQDTEDMLDKLSEDYENWINARLDDEDALLSEIVATVADKGDQINSTLNEIAAKNGTFISDSIRGIFDTDQPFATLMNGIKDAVTGVGTAIADLKNSIAGTTGADRGTNTADKSPSLTPTNGKNNTPTATNGAGGKPAYSAGNSSGKSGTDTSGNGSWGSWFVKKNDVYSKNKLNKDSSIVDRLKYFNIDPEFSKRAAYYKAMGGSGSYISSASQNVWMLNQMKAHGYKNGSYSAGGGWRWTQENGGEFILRKSDGAMFTPLNRGDMVFSNESSKRLYEFAENPEAFMKKYNIDAPAISPALSQRALENRLPSLTNAAQRSASVPINIGGINITCNEVNNARELMEDVTNQLIKNNRFGNAMSTMINNQIMGKNPLEHLKYVKH